MKFRNLGIAAICIVALQACSGVTLDNSAAKMFVDDPTQFESQTAVGMTVADEYISMKLAFVDQFSDRDFASTIDGITSIEAPICDNASPYYANYTPSGGRGLLYNAFVIAVAEIAVLNNPEIDQIGAAKVIIDTERLIVTNYIDQFGPILDTDPDALRSSADYQGAIYPEEQTGRLEELELEEGQFANNAIRRMNDQISEKHLPQNYDRFMFELECGGTGFASFQLNANPKPDSLYLIGKWGVEVCKAAGRNPFDRSSCTGWRRVSVPSEEVVGSYFFDVKWNGQASERGEIGFEGRPAGDYVVELTPDGSRYSQN